LTPTVVAVFVVQLFTMSYENVRTAAAEPWLLALGLQDCHESGIIPSLNICSTDRTKELVMEPMDLLFDAYNANFDRLAQDVRRLNDVLGAPDVSKMWAKRFTREQFDQFLAVSSRPTESKRLFVLGLVHNRDELRSVLPKHLVAIVNTLPTERQSVA